MSNWLRKASLVLLQFMRVPPEPRPPEGSPGSLQIFRAGRNYFRLRRWLWIVRQVLVFLGIAASAFFIHVVASRALSRAGNVLARQADAGEVVVEGETQKQMERRIRKARNDRKLGSTLQSTQGKIWFLWIFEAAGLCLAIAQMFFTYLLLRLDFEQRWYLITDRSLRIRRGITRVHELTLSFANIQQTTIRQGPLQRWMGLADLVVTTAGGGGGDAGQHGAVGHQNAWHTGVLESIENAEQVRDLIQLRLKNMKSSGLGDLDDSAEYCGMRQVDALPTGTAGGPTSAMAAKELLGVIKEWRRSLEGLPQSSTATGRSGTSS